VDYFIMQTNPKLSYLAKLKDWQKSLQDNPIPNELAVVPIRTRCIFVEEKSSNEYPDYFDKPITLIADRLKNVITMYQKDIDLRPVVLIEQKADRQEIYHLIDAPVIDCASSTSKLDHTGKIKELVLDRDKIGNQKIFHVLDFYRHLIVRLDVAESILRRNSYGIEFQKIQLEEIK